MNSAYLSWGIHVTRGPFSSWELETFSKGSGCKTCCEIIRSGNGISCGAGCGEQGCPAETWGACPLVLPQKILFGFALKTSGRRWLSSKALHVNWPSSEVLSRCMWLLGFMCVRDTPRAALVTTRLNNNSLKNHNWYVHRRAAVKFPWVSSLSDVFHPKWEQGFPAVTLLSCCV